LVHFGVVTILPTPAGVEHKSGSVFARCSSNVPILLTPEGVEHIIACSIASTWMK
jgi:hypothetical protein